MQKSKLLALLLAVAMVVSMIVAPAYAVVNEHTCECGATVEKWTEWDGTTVITESGHYKLVPAEGAESAKVTANSPLAGLTVCIDMAGKDLVISSSTAAVKFFSVGDGGTLTLMDSVGGSELKYAHASNTGKGVNGGLMTVTGGTLNMYGVTLTGAILKNNYNGGNIMITDGTVNMYNGAAISNGRLLTGSKGKGSGANVYISGGELNIYAGASITGGSAECQTSGGGNGGNIYINGGAVNMYGGSVTGGSAYYNGDDIAMVKGSLNLYAGTVGAMYVDDGTVKAYNGTIGFENEVSNVVAGCACYTKTENTYTVWNYGHDADEENGVCADEACPFDASEVTLLTGKHAMVEGVCSACGFTVAAEEPELPTTAEGYCEDCEDDMTWNLWYEDTALADVAAGGHWMLAESFQLTAMVQPTADLCVDLNGETLTTKGGTNDDNGRYENIFTVKDVTLSIMDSSEEKTGKLQGGAGSTKKVRGGVVQVTGEEGVLNLYSGTITGGKTNTTYGGGNIGVLNGATANLLGGTVSNGDTQNSGGNILVRGGKLNIDGCSILGGVADGDGDSIRLITATVNEEVLVPEMVIVSGTVEKAISRGDASYPVQIQAGVILGVDPVKAMLDCAVLAYNGEVYKTFDDLKKADAFATAAGSIALYENITVEDDLELTAGSFNLNTFVLTVNGIFNAENTNVVSATGSVDAEGVIFGDENSALPITVGGVTKLEKKPVATIVASKDNATSDVQKFAFYFSTLAEKTLLDDAILEEGNDLTVQIKVSVGGEEVGTYNLANEAGSVLDEFAGAWDTRALVISVSGAEGEVSIEVIVSANGVTA